MELGMSLSSQSTQQKLPFNYDLVFDSLVTVLPSIGFKIKNKDHVIGRITASTGMSLFSWGENITIVIEKLSEDSTLIGIESSLKVGINAAGAHRHAKNFNKIIEILSPYLQGINRLSNGANS